MRTEPTARAEVEATLERLDAERAEAIWIHRVAADELRRRADALDAAGPAGKPLFGMPFAVKDNIDVAGLPTTAGCPSYAYTPERSAPVVDRLLDAGALLVGKTNLDQFATGLVGTRSPYGICRNAHDPDYIAGGSSSGSAVAVAKRLVRFALGTDTAGSGRVPAAFNGLVGLKPSRGVLSTRGVVPACRSLDCVSVFARSAADTARVFEVVRGFDAEDAWSRRAPTAPEALPAGFRFGVPALDRLECFGDAETPRIVERAIARLVDIGGTAVEIDDAPLREAAELLYGGPFVAERYAAVGAFLAGEPVDADPTVASIVLGGREPAAHDLFRSLDRLRTIARDTERLWRDVDVIVLPTAPTIYRVDEVLADPIATNSRLGTYTNFANLLDTSAIALPVGQRGDGLPFGVTAFAPAFQDAVLLDLAHRFLGESTPERPTDRIRLAVVGAHLAGEPLHHQLEERDATFVRAVKTAPAYRLYALAGTKPAKPGLRRVAEGGAAIDVEVYALAPAAFGTFVAAVPPPLAIGTIELADGERVSGFVCEPTGFDGAEDITHLGSWRAFDGRR